MKILFWSEKQGCGTTTNLIAAASMTALNYGSQTAIIGAQSNLCDVMGYFCACQKKREKLTGLDFLLTIQRETVFTKQYLKEALEKTAIERLFVLPLGTQRLCDFYPKETEKVLKRAVHLADNLFDFVFIDCGGRTDDWAKEQMREADLIVVNFRHNWNDFDRFFSKQRAFADKLVYFIGNYKEENINKKARIEKIYRIEPHKLAVIPYNPEFEQACRMGKADCYFLTDMTQRQRYFLEKIQMAVWIFAHAASERKFNI